MGSDTDYKRVGEVVAILNTSQVLIKIDDDCDFVIGSDDRLLVFRHVRLENQIDNVNLQFLVFPKGTIEVQLRQEGNYYIAGIYREPGVRRQRRLSSIQQMIGMPEIIETEVPGEWSAKINERQSLGVSVPSSISKGDFLTKVW